MMGGVCGRGSVRVRSAAMTSETVELFTDGACSGNPGPGGWAFVLVHPASGKKIERAGAERLTTNNRMELRAVIEGLRSLHEPSIVELTSDSKYVLDGLNTWLDNWIGRGWRTAARKPVKNRELWERLDELRGEHQLRFHWIPGHAGHAQNERCDALAVEARERLVREGGTGLKSGRVGRGGDGRSENRG